MKVINRIIILAIFVMTFASCAAPVMVPTKPPISTQTSLPVLTSTATPTLTITPSPAPTAGWGGVLKARVPDLQEINLDSVWVVNLIDVKDMYIPGTQSYSGELQTGKEYAFPAYWCAINPKTLFENLASVSTQLVINGVIVPDEYILTYNYADDTSWHCNYRSVILSGWKQNTQYTLEIRRTLTQKVFDGKSSYEAGDYVSKLTIDVR